MCAGHGAVFRLWCGDESPLHTGRGQALTERQSAHREEESEGSLKQNAGLTNMSRFRHDSGDKAANIAKAQYTYGTLLGKADRHNQEGRANYPWRAGVLPLCY